MELGWRRQRWGAAADADEAPRLTRRPLGSCWVARSSQAAAGLEDPRSVIFLCGRTFVRPALSFLLCSVGCARCGVTTQWSVVPLGPFPLFSWLQCVL